MMKLISRIVVHVFLVQVIWVPAYGADQLRLQTPDFEPPTVLFEQPGSELEEGMHTFVARVIDNVGVASVTLYYRLPGDSTFKPVEMKLSPLEADTYTASLDLKASVSDRLELYLRAEDVSGNAIFEGQLFSPIVVMIKPAAPKVAATAPAKKEQMSVTTMILIGLGVAALAGASGGGGGGGGDPTDPPGTATVTITTSIPE